MDVLVGAMDRFTSKIRGGYVADGHDAPPDGTVPDDFWAFRAGFLRITRLRLVDCFGQIVDLLGSGPATPAAVSRWPIFDFTEPMAQKVFLRLLPRKT